MEDTATDRAYDKPSRLRPDSMYRKHNGSLGFSFTKFAHAVVPNMFADDSSMLIQRLGPRRFDMSYVHQLGSANPFALDERTFYVAGVTDTEGMSKKVFKAVKKHEILREDNTVDTYKIGPKFAHQLAVINMAHQRNLVNMLYWWEEECHRLKKLIGEQEDFNNMIEETEKRVAENDDDVSKKKMLDQMKFARESVRMKVRQRPSQRQPDVENDADDILAAFHGRSKSAPTITTPTAQPRQEMGLQPEYYAP